MKLSHLLRLETLSVELKIFVRDNFRYFLEITFRTLLSFTRQHDQ